MISPAEDASPLNDVSGSDPSVLYTCDPVDDFRIVYISDNVFDQFGFTPKEIISNPHFWLDLVHPDDRDTVRDGFSKILDDDLIVQEYRLKDKAGKTRWIRDKLRLIRDKEGNPVEAVGYRNDVTRQKEIPGMSPVAAASPEQTEIPQNAISTQAGVKTAPGSGQIDPDSKPARKLELAKDIFIHLNEDLEVVTINKTAETMFGIRLEDAVGSQVSDLFKGIPPEVKQQLRQVIALSKPIQRRLSINHPEFGKVLIGVKIFKLGNGLGITAADRNAAPLSEPKSDEISQLYRAIVLDFPQAFILTDIKGTIQLVNNQALQLLGYDSESDFLKQKRNITDLTTQDEKPAILKMTREAVENKDAKNMELTIIRKDNAKIPVEINSSEIRNAGSIEKSVGHILHDISARREAETTSNRLVQQLENNNRELEQIIYVASHDLRSPLVNVQGFSKILERLTGEIETLMKRCEIPPEVLKQLETRLSEGIPEALKYISSSISKMDSLLSGLLRLSRLGKAALSIVEINMSAMMSDILTTLEFQVKKSNARIECGTLPSCKGDEVQINQVFSNIIDNALKYLDAEREGYVRIYGWKEGDKAIYCVEDNGIGIAEADQANIWEVFHRLNPASSKGEGLGLTIAQKILEMHSGKIWVESEPGKGSRFYISLSSTLSASDQGKREIVILIADDDPGNATLIRKNLEHAGILNEIRQFNDGVEILEFLNKSENRSRIRSGRSFLLLLDVRMPRLSGIEVLKRIKEDVELKTLPVIMISSTDDPRDRNRCDELGCSHFIIKPVDHEQFINSIRTHGLFLNVIDMPKTNGEI